MNEHARENQETEGFSWSDMKTNWWMDINEVQINRSSKRKTTQAELSTVVNSYWNENIPYPVPEWQGLPIVSNQLNEIKYLYFPKEELEYLKIIVKSKGAILSGYEGEVMQNLQKFVFLYLTQMFKSVKWEARITESYSEEMIKIKPSYSLAMEMSERFKAKKEINAKWKIFRSIKQDVLKNVNVTEGKTWTFDPFSLLNKPSYMADEKNVNKKVTWLPKWGWSWRDSTKERESFASDDEDDCKKIGVNEGKDKPGKQCSNTNNTNANNTGNTNAIKKPDESKFSYKDIIKSLFVKKWSNDFRGKIVSFCLEKDKDFNDSNFEKCICYIEFFVMLFTGIKVKYYIDELGYWDLDFYASEKIIMNIAETIHYQTQFKILDIPEVFQSALNAEQNTKKGNLPNIAYSIKAEYSKQKQINEINTVQVEEYKLNRIELYPPFASFIKAISDKFRRYDENDNYHWCDQCDKIKSYQETYYLPCSSCFRQIDKSRLIISIIHSICDFQFVEKMRKRKQNNTQKIFRTTTIMENLGVIKAKAKYRPIIIGYLNPLRTLPSKLMNNTYRNVFGEEVGFYYTWVDHYIRWLLFPAFTGLAIHFSIDVLSLFDIRSKNVFLSINLFFTIFIILWGNFYVYAWKSIESVYKHIWGMNSFKIDSSNIIEDNFTKISYIKYLSVRIPRENKLENFFRRLLGYTVMIWSTFTMIVFNLFIFYIQKAKLYEDERSLLVSHELQKINRGYGWYLVPLLIFICREVMSTFYKKIARWWTELEKPWDKLQFNESMIKKRLFLEFFNYYFNLYYIAFIKKYLEDCEYNDCYWEWGNQLIIIIMSDMWSIATQFFYHGVYLRNKTKKLESTILEKYIIADNTSKKLTYYTRNEFNESDLQSLMIPIVLNYGYWLQFGASCPISFVFMLILMLWSRTATGISMSYLLNVAIINESHGIGVFNKIQGWLSWIGWLSNICIMFYTNHHYMEFDTVRKLVLWIIVENFVFLMINVIYPNNKPLWYRYRRKIEVDYLKRFGVRPKMIVKKKVD